MTAVIYSRLFTTKAETNRADKKTAIDRCYKTTAEIQTREKKIMYKHIVMPFLCVLSKTSCRRAAATICPALLLPPWAPKRLAPPSRRQRSSSLPRPTRSNAHRCSRLTRKHDGEQSGLVTLTYDLLTLKMASESRVTWATSVPILVFLGLSVLDLGPMYATGRQTSDNIIALCPCPRLGGGA